MTSQTTAFYPLGGGMDLVSPSIAKPPGTVIASLNYLPVAHGYQRIRGFERFDGRTAPSAGGDRNAITAVPGTGSVRGVWYYDGDVIAVRRTGANDVMYRATPTGWSLVQLVFAMPFTSGGTTEPTAPIYDDGSSAGQAYLTNASDTIVGTLRDVITTSGSWAAGTAAGTFVYVATVGTFAAGDLDLRIAGPGGTRTLVQSNIATVAGPGTQVDPLEPNGTYRFINHNFFGAQNLNRMYGVNGVNQAFEYDVTTFSLRYIDTGMDSDKPTHIAEHKNSLFLGFPGGSVQFSSVGDPHTFDPIVGAGEIAIGDTIADFANPPNALAILGCTSVHILYGNDSTDYVLETLTREAGALPNTVQRIGQVYYMDNRGIRSLASTQAYGNFATGTISKSIQPLLEDKRHDSVDPVASLVCRHKEQYWIFFSDGTGIVAYLGTKVPAFLPFNLGKTVTCAISVEDEGDERLFIGCSDGFVYELDKGTSFDGSAIEHYLRLPFNHFGNPQQEKRFNRIVVELEASGTTSLSLSAELDYGSVPGTPTQSLSVTTGGGAIDDLGSNELYFASQIETRAEVFIDAIGRDISLKIGGNTSSEQPHTLTGVTFYLIPGTISGA